MSTRLYYTDSYLTDFDALVAAVRHEGTRSIAALTQTAFYPTSGGQPADTGRLNGREVLDVCEIDDGGIEHVIEGRLELGTAVHGSIDWPRRFDHMQQHTGQHVLSAAFERMLHARTTSFHLGAGMSTIDLDKDIPADRIGQAESEANRVVWENRPVTVSFVSQEEAAALPLRKEPARTGRLRLIGIEDFDLSACGGTHVARTGAIGVIAVAGTERFKGGTRVQFVCGGRALASYRALKGTVDASVRLLSVTPGELPAAIGRLQAELKDMKRAHKVFSEKLAGFEARGLADRGTPSGGVVMVVDALEGYDAAGLKALAAAVTARPGFIVALFSTSVPALAVVARSSDLSVDSSQVLQALVGRFGGRGGGRPELAQGGGLSASTDELLTAARAAISGRPEPV
jgi:alanyl-tRNA synthetase